MFGNDGGNPFEAFFQMGGLGGARQGAADGELMDTDQDIFGMGGIGGGPKGPGAFRSQSLQRKADPAIERDLYVTLDEVLKGTTKRMKITRKVVGPDGLMRQEEKVLSIHVKPGWKAGTKVTFAREGDQRPGSIPADIVFVIRDKPHAFFKRDGTDIRYMAKVSLRDALCGAVVQVPTLTGEKLQLRMKDIIKPSSTHTIANQGLPLPKSPTTRGNLIVEFDIKFPISLTESAKQILHDVLPAN